MKQVHLTYSKLSQFYEEKYKQEFHKNLPGPGVEIKKPIPKKSRIDSEVLEVLKNTHIENNILFLDGQMDRKLYVKTNKVLESLGGQWNRNKKGHLFDNDPQEILDQVLHNGYYEKEADFGYYPTPKNIVQELINECEIEITHKILEPSAGQGHILDEIGGGFNVVCGELLQLNRKVLEDKGYKISFNNFLEYKTEKFDRIIMNPPFANQSDIDHVNHAFSLLNPGGKLVSIMSNGITFRSTKKTIELRKLIDDNGYYYELPEDSFYTSGTQVRTVLVVLNKEEKN